MCRPFDRIEFGQRNFSDTGQIIEYLFLFIFELVFIRNMLPFTAPAHAEVFAKRSNPNRRADMSLYHPPLGILMFLAVYLQIDNITRRTVRYKNHQIIYPGHSFPFGCNIGYLDLFENRKFFLFSSQNKQILNKNKFVQR